MAKKKVLLVDDEVNFTRMVKLNLEIGGKYDVRVVNDPAIVISVAQEFKPDFVFLDVIMPGTEGPDVAQQLKNIPELKDVEIVFLTAIVRKEEKVGKDGVIAGYKFLAKPITTQELIECIEGNC